MNHQDKNKEKETILTICTALVLLFLFSKSKNLLPLQIAACLGLVGIFSNFLTSKIHWAWMKLAEGMGWIMNKIILGLLFYIVLTPIALLARLIKKSNSMNDKNPQSHYIERNHTYQANDLLNPW